MRKEKPKRFQIVPVFGEARNLFHVVDTKAPHGNQPCIIRTLPTRELAEKVQKLHNSIK